MSDWIPVEDYEEGAIVIFCTDKKAIGVGYCFDGMWTNFLPLKPLGLVTGWMPLPEPPETENAR